MEEFDWAFDVLANTGFWLPETVSRFPQSIFLVTPVSFCFYLVFRLSCLVDTVESRIDYDRAPW